MVAENAEFKRSKVVDASFGSLGCSTYPSEKLTRRNFASF